MTWIHGLCLHNKYIELNKKPKYHVLLGILYYNSICEKICLLLLNRLNHYSYNLKSVCTLILTHRIRRILETAPCRACSTLPNLYRLKRRVLSFPSHGLTLIRHNGRYAAATGGLCDCWRRGLVVLNRESLEVWMQMWDAILTWRAALLEEAHSSSSGVSSVAAQCHWKACSSGGARIHDDQCKLLSLTCFKLCLYGLVLHCPVLPYGPRTRNEFHCRNVTIPNLRWNERHLWIGNKYRSRKYWSNKQNG